MKLHEYQAKSILRKAGIPVPPGMECLSKESLPDLLDTLPPGPFVVKAQVHTGGRGKAGGILPARTPREVASVASSLFGKVLVTSQTGARGVEVRKLYIEQSQQVEKEIYLASIIDRGQGQPVLVASRDGGVEIEQLAKSRPDSILREPFDPWTGLHPEQARKLSARLGLGPAVGTFVAGVACTLAKTFLDWDASLLEINPLGVTSKGVVAMDAKMVLDDNALYRHPEALAWVDPAEENPLEVRAIQAGVNYVALQGNVGCMVNGAGLAMATMDMIKHHGGNPANFLDVGGGANVAQVTEAFRILISDPQVKAILVNIFGGIMKCDIIAQGILSAVQDAGLTLPLVVRLEGTHVDEGRRLLRDSGLPLTAAMSLAEAARQVVAAANP